MRTPSKIPTPINKSIINNYSPKWRWIVFANHLRVNQSERAKALFTCVVHTKTYQVWLSRDITWLEMTEHLTRVDRRAVCNRALRAGWICNSRIDSSYGWRRAVRATKCFVSTPLPARSHNRGLWLLFQPNLRPFRSRWKNTRNGEEN